MYGHVKTNKTRTTSLAFCRYLRSLYPPEVRMATIRRYIAWRNRHTDHDELRAISAKVA